MAEGHTAPRHLQEGNRACILVDSREITTGLEVISSLRTVHGLQVEICPPRRKGKKKGEEERPKPAAAIKSFVLCTAEGSSVADNQGRMQETAMSMANVLGIRG